MRIPRIDWLGSTLVALFTMHISAAETVVHSHSETVSPGTNEPFVFSDPKIYDTKNNYFSLFVHPDSTHTFVPGSASMQSLAGPTWRILVNHETLALFVLEIPAYETPKLYRPRFQGKFKVEGGKGPGEIVPPEWKLRTTLLSVDLDVDSDNNQGPQKPERSHKEEDLEEVPSDEPGKIMPANIDNEDDTVNEAIPDFADPDQENATADTSLSPAIVEIPSNLNAKDIERLEITFEYAGAVYKLDDKGLPEHKELGENHDLGEGQPVTHYRDYSPSRVGPIRLWNIRANTENRNPGKLNPATGKIEGSKFIEPNHVYSLKELGWKPGETPIFIEGILPGEALPVKIKLKYNDPQKPDAEADDTIKVSVAELSIGFNNDHSPSDLLPGTPDIEWLIDQDDENTEDQGRGYPMWTALRNRYQDNAADEGGISGGSGADARRADPGLKGIDGNLDPMEIEDTHPFIIKLPRILKQGKYKFRVYARFEGLTSKDWEATIYPLKDTTSQDLLRDHRRTNTAAQQIHANPLVEGIDNPKVWYELPINELGTPTNLLSLIIRAPKNGIYDKQTKIHLAYSFTKKDLSEPESANEKLLMSSDSVRTWVGENFFPIINYREMDSLVTAWPFKSPDILNYKTYEYDYHNPDITYHVVHVHGYNYNFHHEGPHEISQYYRRLFRFGFRGQYVGINWPSYVVDLRNYQSYDSSTTKAILLGESLSYQLNHRIKSWAGGKSNNIDLYGHSLGNTVCWAALRQNAATNTQPCVRNFFGSESAIFQDGFISDSKPFKYYTINGSNNTLSPSFQSKLTWHGWWDLPNTKKSIGGKYYHGYNPEDLVVNGGMRIGDWLGRESGGNILELVNDHVAASYFANLFLKCNKAKTLALRQDAESYAYKITQDLQNGGYQPKVHLKFLSDYIHLSDPRGFSGGQSGNKLDHINDIPYEIPALVDFDAHGKMNRGAMQLKWAYIATFAGKTELPASNYLYTHIGKALGARDGTGVVNNTKTDSFDMPTNANWPVYIHAGARDQSIPSAFKFYQEILLGNSIYKKGVQK